jgi:septal ring factor EnvC (AmiA/AmiB activator)
VAENEILKQAFKILQKQLLSSKEDNEKLTGALAHTQSETETLKKNNYLLAMRVKSLEMGTSGNLLFGNRDVY